MKSGEINRMTKAEVEKKIKELEKEIKISTKEMENKEKDIDKLRDRLSELDIRKMEGRK